MYTFFFKNHLSIGAILLLSIVVTKETIQRKILRTADGDCIIYVAVDASVKTNTLKTYFWYRSGEIHHSTGGIGGDVLHKEYIKYYNDRQLAEQGQFYYGLKDGLWKSWYPNGAIATVINYQKGVINGKYLEYDISGNLITRGIYRNGLKSGKWIDYKNEGDTLSYKKGAIVKEKIKDSSDTIRKPFAVVKKWSGWIKRKLSRKKDSTDTIIPKSKKEKTTRSKRNKRKGKSDENAL